jgi:hypothetical protein
VADELTSSERALAPRRWSGVDGESPIPPTTPRHPKEPVGRDNIPAGDEGPETPTHFHVFPQWVNGWCVHAWIIWTPDAGAAPLTERAHLMQLHGGSALQAPGAPLMARVVEELRAVNDIFWPQCGIAFQLCGIHVLDTRKVTWGPPANPEPLSGLFDKAGRLTLGANQANFSGALLEVMTNGGPVDFVETMKKRCIHLFFVHDVEDADNPGREEGVGGTFQFGERTVSFGVIDAASPALAQTIAHEIGHSLGHDRHSVAPRNLMREVVSPGDTRLEPEQRAGFLAHLAKHTDPACP